VVLNFAPSAGTISIPFPKAGAWTEKLDEDTRTGAPWVVTIAKPGDFASITVPSNYGLIFTL
jgi:Alpha amylase, C-terminal all-beta domain